VPNARQPSLAVSVREATFERIELTHAPQERAPS
jgi:hypothetical protein